MLKSCRCYTISFILFITTFAICTNVFGSNYKGFKMLNPDECIPLDKKTVETQLPAEWHKFAAFTKICKLKKNSVAKLSIITVGVADFYENTGENLEWKEFPRPIIVDNKYRKVGELPNLYPQDDYDYSDIHLGEWKSGIPAEIRVDVIDYKVGREYYYEPIKWNYKLGIYEKKILEKHSGERPDTLDPYAYSSVYEGFTQLNSDNCVPLDKNTIASQLPAEWHKYSDFIKICGLKQKKTGEAKVSLIAVMIDDYYHTLLLPPTQNMKTKIPLPSLVDDKYKVISQIPEQYFDNDPGSVDIFYNHEPTRIPSIILIDVKNPAVGGDYHYAPLVWDKKEKIYKTKIKESISGKRTD